MRPAGRDLSPRQVLDTVQSGADHSQHEGRPVSLYLCDGGVAYAQGFRQDVNLSKGCGYRPMGLGLHP